MAEFLNQRPRLWKFLVGVLICCIVGIIFYGTGFSAPAPAEETQELSKKEQKKLVEQGVTQYEQGEHAQAKKTLEQAKEVFPANYAVPYYLGLIYLEEGQRSAAIAEWQQYVLMDSESENSIKIRKHLTLLLREEAKESAKKALADEASLLSGPVDENTIAISAFKNMGSENLGPLGKGMAALLIHDLSQAPDLQVVERVRLQALLEEMNLGTSGLVDPKTAPKLGKLLKARHVTTGNLADIEEKNMQIASALVDAEQAESISTQEAQGAIEEFYNLEKTIACGIINDLGRDCSKMPGAFGKIHNTSLVALTAFSVGLDNLDQQKYDEARESFQKALDEDPKFDLAEEYLLAIPATAMLAMSTSETVSGLSSSGVSSTAAGSAVVAGGGVGAGTILLGAAAAAAGTGLTVAAISGGSSDDSSSSSSEPEPGPADGTVTSRNVSISIIDHNTVQDDYYDLYVNGTYIGPVRNPPGGTTNYSVTLNSGLNTIELKLTEIQCCSTGLQMNINSGEFAEYFGGSHDHTWVINAP